MHLKDPTLFRQQCFIGGNWRDGHKSLPVSNPANGEVLGSVPLFGAKETAEAIDSAKLALSGWASKTAKERAVLLRRWFDLMVEHQDDLAVIMTLEQGKPLAESRGEILYAASFIEFFAEEAKRIYGETIPSPWRDARIVVIRQPVGVVAAVTPWNFPSAMIARKAGPALAAGCTFVCKPASETPYSALALAVLAERAGIPAGVFNVITGSSKDIGAEITSNPAVNAVTFTGTTEIGRQLMAQWANTVKKVGLELGGNAPFIVFEDADLDAAVAGAVASKFRNGGQTCVCTNRILVQKNVYNEFVRKLAEAVSNLIVGDGTTPGVSIGPMINAAAIAKVDEHVRDAIDKGGVLIAGGGQHASGGNYYQPTVIAGATVEMKVATEETFGPLAAVFSFETEAEAVAIANDTEFGLACYVFTQDLGRAWRVGEALEYGMVGINSGIISTEVAPFGGIKQSGIGREGSRHGLDEYLEYKYMLMSGIGGP